MRTRSLVLALCVAPALPLLSSSRAIAGDEDDEGVILKLVPKVEKGRRETIDFEGTIEGETKKKVFPSTTFSTKVTREVVSLDDQGRASTERFDMNGFKASVGNSSWSAQMQMPIEVARRGKGRHGAIQNENRLNQLIKGVGGYDLVPDIVQLLVNDPDALGRVLAPENKVKKGDEWEPDAEALLAVFGPAKAKLQDGAKTKAVLETLKAKDGKLRARVTLEAKLRFAPHDDPESESRLTIKATLRGPIDGSQPPESQDVTLVLKSDAKKETSTWKLTRTPIEPDEDEDTKKDDDNKDGKKGEKKPEPKKGDDKKDEKPEKKGE
ncbi:hypothetical protein HY251_11145 [bacterium]|nr:hypothetical protein [bacterium]